jgi:hypothetical protein
MAKCDLTIELTDRRDTYLAGEPVRGVLHLRVNEDVQCNALTIKHTWATHGRGNVTTGEGPAVTLLAEKLLAGQSRRIEFTVNTLPWPPTYHGNYLNIDHAITAHVDIPWAFDITESKRIVVIAPASTNGSEANAAAQAMMQASQKKAGCVIGIIVTAFLMMFAIFALPLALFLVPLLGLIGGGIWLFGSFLPRQKLGPVVCRIENSSPRLGESLRGALSFAPRKPLAINGINVTLVAEEVCVSGSGSNKKTHRHTVFQRETVLEASGELPAGPREYPIDVLLPQEAPPTIELTNNRIEWKATVRVDIPRWPDFVHPQPLQVGVGGKEFALVADESKFDDDFEPEDELAEAESLPGAIPLETAAEATSEISLAETLQFIVDAEGDREQITTIVEGVAGIEFASSFLIERFVLYAGAEDQRLGYPRGRMAYGECQGSQQGVTLYFPQGVAEAIDLQEQQVWGGLVSVVGYDFQNGRVRLKVSP